MDDENLPNLARTEEPHRTKAVFWVFHDAVCAEFQQGTGLGHVIYGVDPAYSPSTTVSRQLLLLASTQEELKGGPSA